MSGDRSTGKPSLSNGSRADAFLPFAACMWKSRCTDPVFVVGIGAGDILRTQGSKKRVYLGHYRYSQGGQGTLETLLLVYNQEATPRVKFSVEVLIYGAMERIAAARCSLLNASEGRVTASRYARPPEGPRLGFKGYYWGGWGGRIHTIQGSL